MAMNFKEVRLATAWLSPPEGPRSKEVIAESKIRGAESNEEQVELPIHQREGRFVLPSQKKVDFLLERSNLKSKLP